MFDKYCFVKALQNRLKINLTLSSNTSMIFGSRYVKKNNLGVSMHQSWKAEKTLTRKLKAHLKNYDNSYEKSKIMDFKLKSEPTETKHFHKIYKIDLQWNLIDIRQKPNISPLNTQPNSELKGKGKRCSKSK